MIGMPTPYVALSAFAVLMWTGCPTGATVVGVVLGLVVTGAELVEPLVVPSVGVVVGSVLAALPVLHPERIAAAAARTATADQIGRGRGGLLGFVTPPRYSTGRSALIAADAIHR
jgi:hypothetical protein